MKKRDKIETVKDLLSDTKKQVLTPSELKFLKSRNVSVDDNKPPLMIYSGDSKAIEKTIRSIASKLNYPIIKIIVSDLKREVTRDYPEPVKEVYEPEVIPEVIPDEVRQDLEQEEPEPEEVEAEPMEVREPEALAEGIRNGNYKLSFPSVWQDDDDFDDMDIPVKNKSDLRLI